MLLINYVIIIFITFGGDTVLTVVCLSVTVNRLSQHSMVMSMKFGE